jgi:two-component system, OmpR family, response regulator RegX3
MRIAILEDDPDHTELLTHWLRLAGHQTHAFERGAELMAVFEHESFDALLLDWNVPEANGIGVLREVRVRLRSRVPIIFVTARDQEQDVVSALTAGADDFLVKPIRRLELLARLEAVARRAGGLPLEGGVFELGPFRVNCQRRSIMRDMQPLGLTAKDFDVAALLLRNVGQLLSRRYLLETVWGASAVRFSRSLDTHVSRVRNKLKLTPEHGWRLTAVYGYGYRLDELPISASRSDQSEPEPL